MPINTILDNGVITTANTLFKFGFLGFVLVAIFGLIALFSEDWEISDLASTGLMWSFFITGFLFFLGGHLIS